MSTITIVCLGVVFLVLAEKWQSAVPRRRNGV